MAVQIYYFFPSKISWLWFLSGFALVTITSLVGFVSSQATTTPSPGASLQAALDQMKVDLGKLRDDMAKINPSRISKIEKDISDINATLTSSFNRTNKSLNDLNSRLTTLNTRVGAIDSRLGAVEAALPNIITGIDELTENNAKQDKEIQHHTKVNQIWKSNFKIVNQTFIALRKKVNFRLTRLSQPPRSRSVRLG